MSVCVTPLQLWQHNTFGSSISIMLYRLLTNNQLQSDSFCSWFTIPSPEYISHYWHLCEDLLKKLFGNY